MEWDKILLNDATDKGLISKIFRQLIKLNIKKRPNWKMSKELNRHFTKKHIQMANRHMKKMFNITNREMQIKNTIQ